MGSAKARALMLESGNPEVTAMAEICEILRQLPDEASRLRVMRWSFGRFNPEFKRPTEVTGQPAARSVEPVAAAPVAVTAEPLAVDPVTADIATEIAAIAPDIVVPLRPRRRETPDFGRQDIPDFGRQLSELEDLFSDKRPRQGTATVHPINFEGL